MDEPLHLEVDRSQLDSQVKAGLAGHQWIQQGPYLICRSCQVAHSVYIGVRKQLVGFKEDGTPELRPIEERDRPSP